MQYMIMHGISALLRLQIISCKTIRSAVIALSSRQIGLDQGAHLDQTIPRGAVRSGSSLFAFPSALLNYPF